jgi:large subunit ribosomal protein L25
MEDFMRINAESRQEVGKKIAKKLRKTGRVPAIIYGDHKESIPISLSLADIKTILKHEKGENTVLKILRDDMQVDAMLKEIQYDYLSDNIIHADFLRIDVNKPVVVDVPITIEGEAIGVKVEDGIFDFMTREVRVKCLPHKIPNEYVVEVSDMHVGQPFKTEDLDLGEDIQLVSDPLTVICAVIVKGKIEEEVEEVVEGEEGEEGEEAAADEEAGDAAAEETKAK